MSGLAALTAPLWAWLGLELLLSLGLWAIYGLLARHLATAAERFLFLKLLFVALVLLPWVPAMLPAAWPSQLSAPWKVLLPTSLPAAVLAAVQTTRSGPGWLAGAAVGGAGLYLSWVGCCLIRLVVAAHQLRSLVRGAKVVAVPGPVPVLLHDHELAPATVGLLCPRILFPRRLYQALSSREVQLILCHEVVHLRRRDPLFNALVLLLGKALVFSPFVRSLARHFESEMELSVDAVVLSKNDIAPREYGHLLFALATQLRGTPEPAGSSVFVARSLIAKRISAMSQPASGKSRKTLLVATFVVVASLCGSGISALRLGPTAWAGPTVAAIGKSVAPQPAEALLQVFLVESGGSHSVTQQEGPSLPLSAMPILTGGDLDSATLQAGDSPTLSIHLKSVAAARFAAFTGSHLGQRVAILLEGKLLAAPVIKSKIDGTSIMLSGQFSEGMRRLAQAINEGRPAATTDR